MHKHAYVYRGRGSGRLAAGPFGPSRPRPPASSRRKSGSPSRPGPTVPVVQQIPRTPAVDQAAHDRGRAIWARECIDCHGSQARGSETGPNIIRTKTVNFDRSSPTPGSVLGAVPQGRTSDAERQGERHASRDEEIVGLAHFLRQRVNDTMRGSPLFTVGDILVGDRAGGRGVLQRRRAIARRVTTRRRATWPASARASRARSTSSSACCFPAVARGGRGRGAAAAARIRTPITVDDHAGDRARRCRACWSSRATSS